MNATLKKGTKIEFHGQPSSLRRPICKVKSIKITLKIYRLLSERLSKNDKNVLLLAKKAWRQKIIHFPFTNKFWRALTDSFSS